MHVLEYVLHYPSSCSPSVEAAHISRVCSHVSARQLYRCSSSTCSRSSHSTYLTSYTSSAPPLLQPAEGGFWFYAAELHFDAETACVLLNVRACRNMTTRMNPVQLHVSCHALDWQLAAIAQICGAVTPLFTHIEDLMLGLHTNPGASMDVESNSDSIHAQWHALLQAFPHRTRPTCPTPPLPSVPDASVLSQKKLPPLPFTPASQPLCKGTAVNLKCSPTLSGHRSPCRCITVIF
jgi:hypothetical protein